jgi:hypothetical protein
MISPKVRRTTPIRVVFGRIDGTTNALILIENKNINEFNKITIRNTNLLVNILSKNNIILP